MTAPWNEGVRGKQVQTLVNFNADTIRVEAGPGTGKTFGLERRVQRILHSEGLNVPGKEVLVVAFNRVIAKQLREAITERLTDSERQGFPVIRTVHALCLEIVGSQLRLLLPHEREAMLYDVLSLHPKLQRKYGSQPKAEQALRDHEARHKDHPQLWQAVHQWLLRHRAQLISDLPGLLLDRLTTGDFEGQRYRHVLVDEFQDLTPGEQELFIRLRQQGGQLVVLGDPRQSIYAFRGNDREGLAKLEALMAPSGTAVTDVSLTECHRCPPAIVEAANRLMGLYDAEPMTPASEAKANIHVVTWTSPQAEAEGMAKAIVSNVEANPKDRHLVMVTRRQFGYWLRERIGRIKPELKVELSFSESLLETWSVREAFIFLCLIADPDPATWRAWLGYQNSDTGREYKAPKRNSDAYLKLLAANSDAISAEVIAAVASAPRKPAGQGGGKVWQRAQRFVELRTRFAWDGESAAELLERILDFDQWGSSKTVDPETAALDMNLVLSKALAMLEEGVLPSKPPQEQLRGIARSLRYQIATREPFVPDETADVQVATLWGAKGVTADHVYVLGLCAEAIPGKRREEYPGTELDYEEEQRRLFYVSITRSRRTLALSRPRRIGRGLAARLALSVSHGPGTAVTLAVCPFLRDILPYLPDAVAGERWPGCI